MESTHLENKKQKTKGIKILVFNWRCWNHPWAGGSERYLKEILTRLARKDYRITLFTSKFYGQKHREILDGIEVIRKGGQYMLYINAALYYLKSLRKRNYDLIIESVNCVPFFSMFYAPFKKRILIIHHITDNIPFIELPNKFLAFLARLGEKLMLLLYKRTPVVTVSESTKKELERYGFKKIYIVHNGVNFEKLQRLAGNPGKKADYPLMLYLGRIKRYKRLDHLLRAFKIVLEKVPEARLVIAGGGTALNEMQKLANDLGVKEYVEFTGSVSEREKAELLRKAWVFVMPSMKEGWGITVIEANACGTPVVVYDVPGLRDSVRNMETGMLVEDGNIEKLAEAVITLIEHNQLRNTLSQNAIEWAKRFSWDKTAETFEKILKERISLKDVLSD